MFRKFAIASPKGAILRKSLWNTAKHMEVRDTPEGSRKSTTIDALNHFTLVSSIPKMHLIQKRGHSIMLPCMIYVISQARKFDTTHAYQSRALTELKVIMALLANGSSTSVHVSSEKSCGCSLQCLCTVHQVLFESIATSSYDVSCFVIYRTVIV